MSRQKPKGIIPLEEETFEEPEFDDHELTYSGKVDLPAGSYLGPGMNGRIWRVVGCMYDSVIGKTKVAIESPKKQ